MKQIFRDILNLFFPSLCLTCGRKLYGKEKHLCLECLSALPKTNYFLQPDNPNEQLLAGRFPFVRVASFMFFVKQGVLQKIIHQLKYHNNQDLGVWLGRLSGQDIKNSAFIENIDYLVPVPLHIKRLKNRGYNQSTLIALGMSEEISVPVCDHVLVRSVNNPTQTTKTKEERFENVDGIFSLKNPSFFKGKHILLVDDILTTGATLEECAKAILKSGDVKISVFTLGSAQ